MFGKKRIPRLIGLKEAFLSADVEKLITANESNVLGKDLTQEERHRYAQEEVLRALERIREIEPILSEENKAKHFIFFVYRITDDYGDGQGRVHYMDASLICTDELVANRDDLFKVVYGPRSIDKTPTVQLKELFSSLSDGFSILQAFEFMDWEEILAFPVPTVLFDIYGKEVVLAAILSEMTFFGVDSEDLEESQNKLQKSIDEYKEAEETGNIQTIPWKQVREQFGIPEPTPEERLATEHLNYVMECYSAIERRRVSQAILRGTT